MISLKVDLKERSYPILIGDNLLADGELLRRYVKGNQVLIVSEPNIAKLYLSKVLEAFSKDYQCDYVLLAGGEENKTLNSVNQVFDTLIQKHHRRSTTLIALGGGVIGDITGFAAACYQRGVDFLQLPTSLLAQVDAAIGGKTGVNHPKAKNMIGSFHQPRAVLIDTATLNSLPDREISAGLAEIIKAALIQDANFFEWLEDHIPKLLARDSKSLVYAIQQACAIKVHIITEDERDSSIRALLNLGHTFGHAIEQLGGYKDWLHGEAVSVGIVIAAAISQQLEWIDKELLDRIKNILTIARLPILLPKSAGFSKLMATISLDKKTEDAGLRLVLLKKLGHATLTRDIDIKLIETVVAENYANA